MNKYTKDSVQTHSDGYRAGHPAVNVKCRHFISAADIAEHFKCSEAQAAKAGEFAWEATCENFWEGAQDLADHYLGTRLKVYSEGRSSGWLVVHGLPPVEAWDAVQLARWRSFGKAVRADVDYRTSRAVIFEAIETNEWHKDGSEAFNFVERPDGSTACIADLKQAARAVGFAPVIR